MVASQNGYDHGGSIAGSSQTTSTSSLTGPFPVVTRQQHAILERVVAAVSPPEANDFNSLQQAYARLGLPENDDETYNLLLRLMWEKGLNWVEKWSSANSSLKDRGYAFASVLHRQKDPRTPSNDQKGRRAGVGNIDVLKAKLDQVTPSNIPARSSSTQLRRDPRRQSPSDADLTPANHRETGLTPKAKRVFLKRRGEGGYSSSDDYVGVPSPPNHRSGGSAALPRSAFSSPSLVKLAQAAEEAPTTSKHVKRVSTSDIPIIASFPGHPLMSNRTRSHSSSAHPILSSRIASALSSKADVATKSYLDREDPEMTATGVAFDRLRALNPLFSHWRAKTAWLLDRAHGIEVARQANIKSWALDRWKHNFVEVMVRRADLERAESQWRLRQDTRLQRDVLGRWQIRRRYKQRAEWEGRLRSAWEEVVHNRKQRLVKSVIKFWHRTILERRARRFQESRLVNLAFTIWRWRYERLRSMQDMADNVLKQIGTSTMSSAMHIWRERLRLRSSEVAVSDARDLDLVAKVWDYWRMNTNQRQYVQELEEVANDFQRRQRRHELLSIWREQVHRRKQCAALARRHYQIRLVNRVYTLWLVEYAGRKYLADRNTKLGHASLVKWYTRARLVCIELEAKADTVLAQSGQNLLGGAWQQWCEVIKQRREASEFAVCIHEGSLVKRAMAKWRRRLDKSVVRERQADVARDFLLQRMAWNRWWDAIAERERERAVARIAQFLTTREINLKRAALSGWIDMTLRAQSDRLKVETIGKIFNHVLLKRCMETFIGRVVDLRDREDRAGQDFELKMKRLVLFRWRQRSSKIRQFEELATTHREMKEREKSKVALIKWSTRARSSQALHIALAKRRSSMLESCFDHWRERSMRSREMHVVHSIGDHILVDAWSRWVERTMALRVISNRRARTRAQVLEIWRAKTTPVELVAMAVELDHIGTQSRAFQIWQIKAMAKKKLRSVSSRNRILGSSTTSSSAYASFVSFRSSPSPSPIRAHFGLTSSPETTPTRPQPLSYDVLERTPEPASPSPASPTPLPPPYLNRTNGSRGQSKSSEQGSRSATDGGGARARLRAAAAAARAQTLGGS
ncbi:hypothetical protein MVLG_00573 [Microbotryum lychnidis-dioicae p1A1 Lamole]|uniref:Sfi1 spindle body domain-containing protein n=1 Tax=Microbotryum lychnidis-dioicae (strain p1A1 Lamole / MvSl-1064) TaxID=683840 RepID=U5GZH1_USTV1|nr:hypothetical protein MVLG_00573 [Microbotryum lychnidis-dioicae p1A1 Lamole]|eukprot:KDE09253.1 hypothetical protein MVLG_00573 [Microbotryum lychnidis-dioicae p1A1 Lamole]